MQEWIEALKRVSPKLRDASPGRIVFTGVTNQQGAMEFYADMVPAAPLAEDQLDIMG